MGKQGLGIRGSRVKGKGEAGFRVKGGQGLGMEFRPWSRVGKKKRFHLLLH